MAAAPDPHTGLFGIGWDPAAAATAPASAAFAQGWRPTYALVLEGVWPASGRLPYALRDRLRYAEGMVREPAAPRYAVSGPACEVRTCRHLQTVEVDVGDEVRFVSRAVGGELRPYPRGLACQWHVRARRACMRLELEVAVLELVRRARLTDAVVLQVSDAVTNTTVLRWAHGVAAPVQYHVFARDAFWVTFISNAGGYEHVEALGLDFTVRGTEHDCVTPTATRTQSVSPEATHSATVVPTATSTATATGLPTATATGSHATATGRRTATPTTTFSGMVHPRFAFGVHELDPSCNVTATPEQFGFGTHGLAAGPASLMHWGHTEGVVASLSDLSVQRRYPISADRMIFSDVADGKVYEFTGMPSGRRRALTELPELDEADLDRTAQVIRLQVQIVAEKGCTFLPVGAKWCCSTGTTGGCAWCWTRRTPRGVCSTWHRTAARTPLGRAMIPSLAVSPWGWWSTTAASTTSCTLGRTAGPSNASPSRRGTLRCTHRIPGRIRCV